VTVTFKARVQGGRLTLDEPIDLPDGSELELVPAEQDDALDDAERQRLHRELELASGELSSGQGIPAEQALARLRARDAD
jgi:hypothetical protein